MNRRRNRRRGKKKKKKSLLSPEERVKELEGLLVKEIRASRQNEEVWSNRNKRLNMLLGKMSENNDDLKHEMERVTNENLDILNRERESFRILEIKLKRLTNYNRKLFEKQENLKTEAQQKEDDFNERIKEMKDFYEKQLSQKNNDVAQLQETVMRHLEARYMNKSSSTEKEVKEREIIYQQKVNNLQKQFNRVLHRQKKKFDDRLEDEVSRRLVHEHEFTVSNNKVLQRDVTFFEDELLEKRLENDRLKGEIRRFESDVLILSSQCDDLIKRNGILQHKIYTLEEVKGLRKNERAEKELSDLKKSIEEKKVQIEERDNNLENLQKSYEKMKINLQENIKTFNILKKEYQKRFEMNSEISKFIYSVIKDIKLKLGPWKRLSNLYTGMGGIATLHEDDDGKEVITTTTTYSSSSPNKNNNEYSSNKIIPANLDKLDVKEREKVLRYLLQQLNLFTKKKTKTKYVYTMKNKERLSLPPIHGGNFRRNSSSRYFQSPSVEDKNIFRKYRDYRKRRSIYN